MFDKYKAKDITISYMEKYAQLKHLLELKEHPERITEEDLKINQFLNIYFEPTNRCNLIVHFVQEKIWNANLICWNLMFLKELLTACREELI